MKEKIYTHVIDVHERGGRFGEDILSVRCRFCKKIWTDSKKFSERRTGEKACPAR